MSIGVIRPFRKRDIPALRAIHARAGYGFEFPELKGMIGKQVIEDEEGNVVGFVGAQREAQIIGIFDPEWGTPGERMRAFSDLHRPIAKTLEKHSIRESYVACDPKYRAFGRRLMSLGWKKALWTQYFIPVGECLARFGKKAA